MSTRAPFADWQPTSVNFTYGGVQRPPRGMVVHTAVGSYDGTIGWFRNPGAHVSSYFVVAQDGRIAQCVDLDDKAWTQAAGNTAWIGVENEGNSATPLTEAQIVANARILAWLHTTFGVPLALTTDPINGHGLGYHQMGGKAWSPAGHTCPGPIIVAQLPQIVTHAQALVIPTPKVKTDMDIVLGTDPIVSYLSTSKGAWLLLASGAIITLTGSFYGTPYGTPYWKGRQAAQLRANPNLIARIKHPYVVIDTTGAVYGRNGF